MQTLNACTGVDPDQFPMFYGNRSDFLPSLSLLPDIVHATVKKLRDKCFFIKQTDC